jgi:hypothetical protein
MGIHFLLGTKTRIFPNLFFLERLRFLLKFQFKTLKKNLLLTKMTGGKSKDKFPTLEELEPEVPDDQEDSEEPEEENAVSLGEKNEESSEISTKIHTFRISRWRNFWIECVARWNPLTRNA